jgi:dTDP-4-dehydrorhamnose reductase
MAILLFGGSGYLGKAFRRCLEQRDLEYRSVRRNQCDYYDHRRLEELICELAPEFLINAAGFTGKPNVDACEWQKAECLRSNAVLPGVIRDVCESRRLTWGHVSSGCIYHGYAPPLDGMNVDQQGFRECDPPNFTFRQNNCSFYSGCKALGEEVLQEAERCYIWRIRIPFNHVDSPRNYLSKLMRYERLLDVRNSLSHLDECVAACVDCWLKRVPFGTYHLTNSGSVTTREVVDLIRASGVCDKVFRFFDSEEEFGRVAAKTPRSSCVLDNRKARDAGLQLSHVMEAIERSLRQWDASDQRSDADSAIESLLTAP